MDDDDIEAIMRVVSEERARRIVAAQLAALAETSVWPAAPPEDDA